MARLYPQLKEHGEYFVGGRVGSSGTHPFSSDERQTITTAIMKAGGFGQFANKGEVLLGRKNKRGEIQITAVDVDMICRSIPELKYLPPAEFYRRIRESGWQLPWADSVKDKDLLVQPGDVIVVKQYHLETGWETVMDALKKRSVSAR